MAVNVAFVVQRYGPEVGGGAELHCRLVAEHMARYWDVTVLTTRALDYLSWRDTLPEGEQAVNGVRVLRFSVDEPRYMRWFNRVGERLRERPHSLEDERWWMRLQGPYSSALLRHLETSRLAYEAVIFFTYQYCHTFFGLPLVQDRALLVPTAHDDWVLRLAIFRELFRLPRALLYNTPEERDLLVSRFAVGDIRSEVVGVGVSAPAQPDPEGFRARRGLDGPLITFVGRIDPDKGCGELFDFFLRYRDQAKEPPTLLLLGSAAMPVPEHPAIRWLGYVSEQEKFDALAASAGMVAPSPYESLSMACLESWLMETPVLVTTRSAVLRGQVHRSQGGLAYSSYDEFAESLDRLLGDRGEAREMGRRGRAYVVERYRWEEIKRKYLALVQGLE